MREPLKDADELLHRQVHPKFIDKDRVGSQAFRPTPKDQGELSVSRGSLASARDAYLLYTQERGLESAGVWSVTIGECSTVGLTAFPEPLTEPVNDPAHTVIDFRDRGSNAIERLSKRLAAFARARGRQYPEGENP